MADIPRASEYGGYQGSPPPGKGPTVADVIWRNRYSKRSIEVTQFDNMAGAKDYVRAMKQAGLTGPGTENTMQVLPVNRMRVY